MCVRTRTCAVRACVCVCVCALTSEGVGPEGEEGQGEGEVTHTRVGLEQSHQREQDIGQKHWVITDIDGGRREGGKGERNNERRES